MKNSFNWQKKQNLIDALGFGQCDFSFPFVSWTISLQCKSKISQTARQVSLHQNVTRINVTMANAWLQHFVFFHFGVQMRDTTSYGFCHFCKYCKWAGVLQQPVLKTTERRKRHDQQIFYVVVHGSSSIASYARIRKPHKCFQCKIRRFLLQKKFLTIIFQ